MVLVLPGLLDVLASALRLVKPLIKLLLPTLLLPKNTNSGLFSVFGLWLLLVVEIIYSHLLKAIGITIHQQPSQERLMMMQHYAYDVLQHHSDKDHFDIYLSLLCYLK